MARVAVVVAALVVSAWFGLGWWQARQTGRAAALVAGAATLTPAQAWAARADLDAAATLNPDLTVDVLRGELAAGRHDLARAIAILRSVTAREPLNLSAWAQLGFAAARAGDRRLLAVAGRHIASLIPVRR